MTTVTNKYPASNQAVDIDKLKSDLIKDFEIAQVKKSNFPTELISLPSLGLLYSEDSPLRDGTIELKYMTAREEEILVTPSYLKQNVAIDKLLQAVIVTPIKYDDLVLADKDAILVASRILGYGHNYLTKCICPECFKEQDHTFNLKQLYDKNLDISKLKQININEFEYTLPKTQRVITFKFLTVADEKILATKNKNTKEDSISRTLTTKFKHQILSIDGSYDIKDINSFVDEEFFAMDSRAFREYYAISQPGINYEVEFNCDECTYTGLMALPIGIDFFWARV